MQEVGEIVKNRHNYKLSQPIFDEMRNADPGTFDPVVEEKERKEKFEIEKQQRKERLEEELKQLYTAITRARVRIAMYDANEDKRRPVFSYLHSEGRAEAVDEACNVITAFVKEAEDWGCRKVSIFV